MLLIENELMGSLAEADLQAINLQFRFPNLLNRSLKSVILSVDGTIAELQDRKSSTPSTSKPVPVLDSPCSVASDGSSTNWNGIPRVRRKWVDVVEGELLSKKKLPR